MYYAIWVVLILFGTAVGVQLHYNGEALYLNDHVTQDGWSRECTYVRPTGATVKRIVPRHVTCKWREKIA